MSCENDALVRLRRGTEPLLTLLWRRFWGVDADRVLSWPILGLCCFAFGGRKKPLREGRQASGNRFLGPGRRSTRLTSRFSASAARLKKLAAATLVDRQDWLGNIRPGPWMLGKGREQVSE